MVECRCYGNSSKDSYGGGPRGERRVVKGLVDVGWSTDPRLAQQGKPALAKGYRAHQPEALNDCSTYLRREGTAWTTGAKWCQAPRHSVQVAVEIQVQNTTSKLTSLTERLMRGRVHVYGDERHGQCTTTTTGSCRSRICVLTWLSLEIRCSSCPTLHVYQRPSSAARDLARWMSTIAGGRNHEPYANTREEDHCNTTTGSNK